MRELIQMFVDYSRDALFTEQAVELLKKHYLKEDEKSPQDGFARAANAFCNGDLELAQRIYDYASKQWFMFASPILSNAPSGEWVDGEWHGEKAKAMPISCFALYVDDSIKGQIDATTEAAWLSVKGGGVGMHNAIRAVSNKAPGPIPFLKTLDASVGYYRQSVVRRGSYAYYMDVDHPDIVEFINFRTPTGGDVARKSNNTKNFHIAVNTNDEFEKAVDKDLTYDLKCPHTGEVKETVRARKIWEMILDTRALTGEPYIFRKDVANRDLPLEQQMAGLKIHGSNLCSEIALPTNIDRTFVCCLSSLNLLYFDEWKGTTIVRDLITFLDNVLQFFIENAPDELSKAVYSATMERALGLGTMGFHSYLQSRMIPWESGGFNSATQMNHMIYSFIQREASEQTRFLAEQRGAAPDMKETGVRNSHLTAIAPNANSSMIAGVSPSIEPISANAFVHRTRVGAHLIKNPQLESYLRDNFNDKEIDAIWEQVIADRGSVQNVIQLSDEAKQVFKTAWEIDQHWVVQHAEDRQQYIDQAQSLNLFFPSGSSKEYINSVHLKGIRGKSLKSFYYFRTESKVTTDIARNVSKWNDPEVCVSCEG